MAKEEQRATGSAASAPVESDTDLDAKLSLSDEEGEHLMACDVRVDRAAEERRAHLQSLHRAGRGALRDRRRELARALRGGAL